MKEDIKKSIKRCLKRKVTITLGMMVAFMITGGMVYSNDGVINQEVSIKVENGIITVTPEGAGIVEGNTWINNGKIEIIEKDAVIIDESVTAEKDFNLINKGIISGTFKSSQHDLGNGIVVKGVLNDITNEGLILGNVNEAVRYSGDGIYIYISSEVNLLINKGIILGENKNGSYAQQLHSGNGIYINGKINTIMNDGKIAGNFIAAERSGNGIGLNQNNIEIIKNNGAITGNGNTFNAGNGMLINNDITIIENAGVILGKNSKSGISYGYFGNGILLGGKINELTNSGIIMGKGYGGSLYTGYGITRNQNINDLINYGIIAGYVKALSSDLKEGDYNYGLLIDGAGTDNQTISAGAGGEQAGKYIINGVNSSGEDATASAIKSSELESKITTNKNNYYDGTFYENLVVNMVGDTDTSLNLDTSLSTLSSTINGYKDAIVFTEKGKTFCGENVIINGGENAFVGSDGVDKIYLKNLVTIGSVQSIVNGNISLGGGNDILDVQAETIINGNIDMGDGADTIKISSSTLNGDITADGDTITMNTSSINGNLNLTNSNMDLTSTTLNGDITANGGKIGISGIGNRLFNVGSTTINGDITITDGEIYVKDGSILNGDITLNGGKATVWLDKNQTMNDKINIVDSVTEKVLGVNYNVTDDDMTALVTQSSNFNSIKLKDGGNTITLTDLNINSITGGSGEDNFKTTITGFRGKTIDGGEGSDTLALTDNITEGNQVDFSKVTNIENLQLTDGRNTLDISDSSFTTIIGGSGNDTFINVGSTILFGIKGGEGNDTITMKEGVTLDNIQANSIFTTNGIENLNLIGDNTLSLDDLTYTKNINFGTGDNSFTLGIENSGTEFDFTQNNLINGNVGINLNGNTGRLESTFTDNTVTLDKTFTNGNVIFTNGTIKFEIGNTTF